MKNLYNEFINKNLKDLFKPAVEYIDKEKTGKYRPAEELIEKGGADTLCGIFNNLMGERDYSHFSGKITNKNGNSKTTLAIEKSSNNTIAIHDV